MTQTPGGELWVFGYGSLMWRPGFSYTARHRATICGWRRRLCIESHVYRGTPENPGLVFGLDRGGMCEGVAFRVPGDQRAATIEYLREREQVTSVYLECIVPTILDTGVRVTAMTYVADRDHPQYAGQLDREAMLEVVRHRQGKAGSNADYVLATYDHLVELNVRDAELDWLAGKLREIEKAT